MGGEWRVSPFPAFKALQVKECSGHGLDKAKARHQPQLAHSMQVFSSIPAAALECRHMLTDAMIHERGDILLGMGLSRHLKHFGGPWLLDGAQGLPQLDVDVHGAWVRGSGLPVGSINGGERHARWDSCARRRHVERPARISAKDLHLGDRKSSHLLLSEYGKGHVLLSWPQMAQTGRSTATAAPVLPCV